MRGYTTDLDNAAETSQKDKFDAQRELHKAEGEAREAIVKMVGAIVLLGGFYFTYRTLVGTARFSILQRYTEAVSLLSKSDIEKPGSRPAMMDPMAARFDISKGLIHFVRRGESPWDAFSILRTIICERRFLGGNNMIRGNYPCVCFTEAPLEAFADMPKEVRWRHVRYEPIGSRLSISLGNASGGYNARI
jgi:hypothetical protein